MDETRKPDAADVAPRPTRPVGDDAPSAPREVPDDRAREDGGRVIPAGDLNSANDE